MVVKIGLNMALRIPPLLQFFICAVVGWAASQALESLAFSWTLLLPIGVALVGTGIAIGVVAVGAFARASTTVNPIDPNKAETLVTTGIFRVSRNPMYLGMLLVLIGGAFLLSNLSALIGPALFVAAMTELQIKPEEQVLQSKFGDTYRVYSAQTRRWI